MTHYKLRLLTFGSRKGRRGSVTFEGAMQSRELVVVKVVLSSSFLRPLPYSREEVFLGFEVVSLPLFRLIGHISSDPQDPYAKYHVSFIRPKINPHIINYFNFNIIPTLSGLLILKNLIFRIMSVK